MDYEQESKQEMQAEFQSTNQDKIRTPVQKRSIQTRNQIIEAGMKLFSEKGYHNTNSKEIAKAAGVSTGCFYSYFLDKQKVFIEALKRYMMYFNETVNSYMEQVPQQTDDKRKIMAGLIESIMKAHRFFTGFHNDLLVMRIEDPEIEKILYEEEKESIKYTLYQISLWSKELKVTDLDAAAVIIFTLVHRVVDLMILNQTDIQKDRLVNETADMVVKYLFT